MVEATLPPQWTAPHLAESPPMILVDPAREGDHSPRWPTDNRFLNGPFSPWTEESQAFDLEIVGELPADLAGALFRATSNSRFRPRNLDRYHWFEGDGMVGAIYVRDGRAAYRARWVDTDTMRVEVEAGEAIYDGFANGGGAGRPPAGAPFYKNLANTNVGLFDDRLLIYFEGGLPHQMHPETLETFGTYDFHGGLDAVCTAHFKIDPLTGDMLFYAAAGQMVTWYRADVRDGKVIDTHTFDIGLPLMLHDFAVTETFAIFFVTPAQARYDFAMQGRPGLVWNEDSLPGGVEIVLMDRRTHAITRHQVGGMFSNTHYYNAHEANGQVIIDGHRITRLGTPIDRLDTLVRPHEWFPPAYPTRWRVDLATGRAFEEQLSGLAGEFPKINDAYLGQAQRYGYFVTTRDAAPDTMSDGLARYDYLLGTTVVVDGPESLTSPSEPVFVAREGASAEDDGYLLSVWWNRETQLSELLVHDASDLRRQPLARVKLPARLPFGFHGNWAAADILDKAIATRNTEE